MKHSEPRSLLTDPNFDDPLNGAATQLFKKDRAAYEKKCRELVQKHAMSVPSLSRAAVLNEQNLLLSC